MSTLDVRPAGFNLLLPPGGATIEVVAGEGQLAGTSLAMWLQGRALAVPDVEQAVATAQLDDSDIAEDRVAFTLGDLSELDQGEFYRVIIADGDQPWCNGLARVSNDGTAAQSTTLTVTVASGAITLDISAGPGAPAGGSGLPAGTAGQMFRVGTDGETVEAVSPNAPNSWLRLNGTGHVPDVHLAAGIVRESELAAAIANGAVVLVVATVDVPAGNYGGVFDGDELTIAGASGAAAGTYLLRNQTSGTNNDLWTHDGLGVFTRQTPGLALSRVGTYVASPATLGGANPQLFRVTGANQVTELVVTTEQVQALIDATGVEAGHDYRAHEERLGLVQAPQFRKGAGDSQSAAWTSPADAVPTSSYGILFTGRVDELSGASWFHECMHRGMDAGVGAADSIELAIREWDGATYPPGSDELPAEGALWLYAEGTNQASGEAWESGDPLPETWQINVDADIRLGCWFTVLMWHNLTTGTVTLYREIDYGGVELVGRRWRQVAQLVDLEDAGSVYLDPAEPWACGVRFQGPWREAEIYIDGALAYAPRPDEYAPDSEGNTWTTSTGTVEQSLDARVDTLEADDPFVVTIPGSVPTLIAGVANFGFAMRAYGSGTISKIGLQIGTSAGDICVGVYTNSGVGPNAVPATRVATSGAVACPSSGYQEVALTAPVYVRTGDWLAVSFSSSSATAYGAAAPGSSIANNGLSWAKNGNHPLPSSFAPTAGDRQFRLWGVP